MRILVTNDDGINAPGLKVLEEIANRIAGPEGEVWVVAPAFEQSGVGHCISYTHPMLLSKLGHRRYAAEGSPADCVLAGFYDVLQGARPDLVLSGVNRGNNAAENVLYSGTIGGAMEAALHAPEGELEAMGREGRRRVSDLHDVTQNAAQLRALFSEAIVAG
jgi:5'-nucleotidase